MKRALLAALTAFATWHVAAGQQASKPMTAEAILDRYVQVTGGAELYHRFGAFTRYETVTRADGTSFNIERSHSRDGDTRVTIDDGDNYSDSGSANGVVWVYSKTSGAKILQGKAADRELAQERGLTDDDWRVRFSSPKLLGTETVNGKTCYHVTLTQADGSKVDRFYDVNSGLLWREMSMQVDASGVDQPVVTDVLEYDTTFGIKHPSSLRIRQAKQTLTVHIDSITFWQANRIATFDVPAEVVRAIAERRSGGSLPNAVDLVEKFMQATGGRDSYRSIKTEAIHAEVSFPSQRLKFPFVMYAARGKSYASLDIPSIGKFEFGNDGRVGWQKSLLLGPQLQPRSAVGGLLGPSADDVLLWTESDLTLETLAKEDVNGAACYKVRLSGDEGGEGESIAWFDAQTGLLVKSRNSVAEDGKMTVVETMFADYREQAGFKTAYHVETKVAGQTAFIDISDLTINQALPQGVFDLPPDVRALKDKKVSDALSH